jgi:predicted AlkP superfamily pyrophosphatase or phosphodiesterase
MPSTSLLRWLLLGALLSNILSVRALAAEPSEPVVVLISVDGLAAFYFDDPRASMPTLRALAADGVFARMTAVLPTVTWPNHTTLVTGTTPARHGVLGNDYFDRKSVKKIALLSDPEFDKDEIVKSPTLYDVAKASGLSTAAVRWPATRNAKTLDWTVPDVAKDSLLHQYTTPALLDECKAAGIWEDGEMQDAKNPELRIVRDETCTNVFLHILKEHRPRLAILHLLNVDHIEHVDGPQTPEAYAAIAAADEQVGQIWKELQKSLPGQATLFVVSDHGFSRVEKIIQPYVELQKAGLVKLVENKVTDGDVRIVTQGGSCLVYLLDESQADETAERVRSLFDGAEGIANVIDGDQLQEHGLDPKINPNCPDMVLFAEDGYFFSGGTKEDSTIIKSDKLKGMHGHDETMPIMHATFVAAGRGIKKGAKLELIRNVDVAPTAAKLLGLELPNVDGKVLTDALSD